MSESIEHQNYVRRIVEYIKVLVPHEYSDRIRADLPEYEKPSLAYNSFIPDVTYSYEGLLIIGEAKTFNDFSRDHSRKQYEAYVKECKHYPGNKVIIIAVPWQLFITAKNHFTLLKRRQKVDVSVIIISENGMKETV